MSTQVIWKFTIEPDAPQFIVMPKGARILSVGNQNDQIALWALVDPEAPKVRHFYELIPTGLPVSVDLQTHIGTVLLFGGSFVAHVFDAGEAELEEVPPC